ncbi:MAG: cache domain-containing protein [Desulfobacterales bacterium]|nr:cache domain-containing protein [Desulfobacterales bacterium]
MFYSTRFKLISSFIGVTFLLGAVFLLIGGRLLYETTYREASNRVRLDLNAAREIYQSRIDMIKCPLIFTSQGSDFRNLLKQKQVNDLYVVLENTAKIASLDFIGIVNETGIPLCRLGNQVYSKYDKVINPIVKLVIERLVPIAGTVIFNNIELTSENPTLAEQARIKCVPTPFANNESEQFETSGMTLSAAIPIVDQGVFLGVIYGGTLLNKSTAIVDTIRDTVFQSETYKNQLIGTTTIFLNDLRISTNVIGRDGNRAIGTRVSENVNTYVLQKGQRWTDRAFVVNDWYLTAYEPIEDIFGKRVGILYVGVLEKKYLDIRNHLLSIFIGITVVGMLIASVLGYVLAQKIMRPVYRLIKASKQVSEGNLSPEIGQISKSEIGILQKTFQRMISDMARKSSETENQILQSEKQASVGRLAAGVAHEINNPLTGVLTFTHMLLRRKDISDEVRQDLKTIAEATDRVRKIVKGLLDFSRQTELDPELTDVNRLIQSTYKLIENQALLKGVNLFLELGENLPSLVLDRSQMRSVLLNMIINALDATEPGGHITINTSTALSLSDSEVNGVEITISDTGCGISPENMHRLFDPFFTTKEVGKGTGLGLSVSYGIVKRHKGTIRVQSEVAKGTKFFIWLPIHKDSPDKNMTDKEL